LFSHDSISLKLCIAFAAVSTFALIPFSHSSEVKSARYVDGLPNWCEASGGGYRNYG
jgi:hypothetical protein